MIATTEEPTVEINLEELSQVRSQLRRAARKMVFLDSVFELQRRADEEAV